MNELHLDLDLSDFDLLPHAIGLGEIDAKGVRFLLIGWPDSRSTALLHQHEMMMHLERNRERLIEILPPTFSVFDALVEASLPLLVLKNIPLIPVTRYEFPFDMSSIKASYRYKNFVDLEARNTQWKNNALRHQNAGKSKKGRL